MTRPGPIPKSGPTHAHPRESKQAMAYKYNGDFPRGSASEEDIPKPGKRWHPVAIAMFEKTIVSRQAQYYEPSDYMTLWVLCEQLSRLLKPRYIATDTELGEPIYAKTPLNGTEMTSFLKGLTQLGITVADRRRLEIDIRQAGQSDKDDERAVASIDEYRERLRLVQ